MSWQLEVDGHACIASGMCVGLAPEFFRLGPDHSEPIDDEIEPDGVVLDAADTCPAMAITVREGSEVIGPRP
ncbi:MAG TPA: ferredoxin [Actinophytocola sp.]|jgi:ferredoxin|uniref:ferredoxin n=1 Tax=Actinophytocola sp. TaxID=1872138 RepID=UPI002E0C4B84|nr:ferredoxin [Actinophytocola sp.]